MNKRDSNNIDMIAQAVAVAVGYKIGYENRIQFDNHKELLLENFLIKENKLELYRGISVFEQELELWGANLNKIINYHQIHGFSSWTVCKAEAERLMGRRNNGQSVVLKTTDCQNAIDYSLIYNLAKKSKDNPSNQLEDAVYNCLLETDLLKNKNWELFEKFINEREIVLTKPHVSVEVIYVGKNNLTAIIGQIPDRELTECFHQVTSN